MRFSPRSTTRDRTFALSKSGVLGFLFLSAAVLTTSGCQTALSDETVIRIDSSAISARMNDPNEAQRTLLIDVRPAEAYQREHVPGAVNIRLAELVRGEHRVTLANYKPLIVYGQNPASASAMAMAKTLISRGHKDVRLFEGGIEAWRSAGLTLDQGRVDLRELATDADQP